ncbi:MAG: beta-ketoacyl synthase N-terminal-like domain-containing protein, partial [Sphingomonadales bacterium]
MRRVVVTGLGLVTPLGCGVEVTWKRLLAGQSGAARIARFDPSDLTAQIACEVKRGDGSDGTFNADDWVDHKVQRQVDDFIIFGIAAAQQAVEDSGWVADTEAKMERSGVLIGSGIGGLPGIQDAAINMHEKGA